MWGTPGGSDGGAASEDDLLGRLTALVLAGDVPGTTALVLALDERSRAPLWRPTEDLERPDDAAGVSEEEGHRRWMAFTRASQVVMQGCGTPEGAAHLAGWHADDTEVVIRSRPRAWRDRWADLATRTPRGIPDPAAWRLVRRLVVDGACAEPDHDDAVRGAIRGLLGAGDDWWTTEGTPLVEGLRADPGFLEGGLWRLFEVEGVGDLSLDRVDGTELAPWTRALQELASDGTVDRDRLLDAALSALRRDFPPNRARWYRDLHDTLRPTDDERSARQGDYRALCGVPDPTTVRVGTRALLAVAKAARLDVAPALQAVRAALAVRTKGPAIEAVRILETVLRSTPSLAPEVTDVAADALLHASRDVQERGIALVEAHHDHLADAVRSRLWTCADDADPAIRPRIRALVDGGAGAPAPPADDETGRQGPDASPALPPARTVVPGDRALRPEDRLRPVVDAEDLLQRLVVLIETGDDPDELELLLDGAGRLADTPPPAGHTTTLLRRARALLADTWGDSVSVDASGVRALVAVLVLAWLKADPPAPRVTFAVEHADPRTGRPAQVVPLGERVRSVIEDVARGEPRLLLATPTHRGGWIDPGVVAGRLSAPDVADDARERELALLRLHPSAPDGTRAAISRAAPRRGGGPGDQEPRDPRAVADVVLRAPWAIEWEGPDTVGSAARPGSWLSLGLAARVRGDEGITRAERWLATVAPADPESVAVLGLSRLLFGPGSVNHGAEDFVQPLLDDRTPLGPVARLMLVAAACSDWAPARTTATDVLIQALGDLRLDGDGLAVALARIGGARRPPGFPRGAAVLDAVAAEGPLHAHHVQGGIEGYLASRQLDAGRGAEDPTERTSDLRDVSGLVDLLRRLATDADARVADRDARRFLEGLPPRTKPGRAAREALLITGTGARRTAAAWAVVSRSIDGGAT